MKKKLWIVIVAAALVLTAGIGMTVYGIVDADRQKARDENAKIDDWVNREDAPATQTAVIGGTTKGGLTYSQTKMLENGESIDVYLDEEKNEFRYQTDGKLVGYYNKEACSLPAEIDASVTAKVAVTLANKHATDFYGAAFEKYKLTECTRASDGSFPVYYAVGYGDGGFIRGDEMCVTVGADGVIMHSTCNPDEVYSNFDANLLANVTKAEIDAALADWVEETFGDKVISYESGIYKLVYEDNRYAVRVTVDLDKVDYVTPDLFYFEID